MVTPASKYLILKQINQGGMAEIFLAKRTEQETDISDRLGTGAEAAALEATHVDIEILAMKAIRSDLSTDPKWVLRFNDEAQLASRLLHPNIARVYEKIYLNKRHMIVMEYISGQDLRAIIKRSKHVGIAIPVQLCVYIVLQILAGLSCAHEQCDGDGNPLHVVHRDISPHNILVSYTGEVKVIDFGIAKAASQVSKTEPGVLRGKYGYMSPEQVMGRPLDCRSDLFAVGTILYELLTQTRLFTGSSDFSIMSKVRFGEIYPPTVISSNIPHAIEEVFLTAIKVSPKERFASAIAMSQALQEQLSLPLPAAKQHTEKKPEQAQLAIFLRRLFSSEIEDEMRMLARARTYQSDDEPFSSSSSPQGTHNEVSQKKGMPKISSTVQSSVPSLVPFSIPSIEQQNSVGDWPKEGDSLADGKQNDWGLTVGTGPREAPTQTHFKLFPEDHKESSTDTRDTGTTPTRTELIKNINTGKS